MAAPTWPSTFPDPDANGFAHEPEDILERTQMRIGPQRVRLIQTTPITKVPQTWTMSMAQYSAFIEWFAHTLSHGAKSFYAPIFKGGTFETHEVRFTAPYRDFYISPSEVGVSATLEILDVFVPIPIVSDAVLMGAEWITYTQLGATNVVTLGTAPNPHTPKKVEIRIEQAFKGGSAIPLYVGRSTSGTPTELVNLTDLRSFVAPSTILVASGYPYAGTSMNVLQNAQRTYVAKLDVGSATLGRALVAVYWDE